jgi:hypothetical protein
VCVCVCFFFNLKKTAFQFSQNRSSLHLFTHPLFTFLAHYSKCGMKRLRDRFQFHISFQICFFLSLRWLHLLPPSQLYSKVYFWILLIEVPLNTFTSSCTICSRSRYNWNLETPLRLWRFYRDNLLLCCFEKNINTINKGTEDVYSSC